LAHEVTKEARKEFDLGCKAWRKSQFNNAQTHFAEAIRLDPGFLQALTGLAVVHLKLSQPELALNDLNRALLPGA
jgi:Flp pilus assembly protein TadD